MNPVLIFLKGQGDLIFHREIGVYHIRRARLKDIPILISFREKMFRSISKDSQGDDKFNRATQRYLETEMKKRQFVAWIAETVEGQTVASAAVSFFTLPPKPWNIKGKYAYISSMFTEPSHRRKGLAHKLLQIALDYAKDKGFKHITLHASNMGEPLYYSVGFQRTNEMRIKFIKAG